MWSFEHLCSRDRPGPPAPAWHTVALGWQPPPQPWPPVPVEPPLRRRLVLASARVLTQAGQGPGRGRLSRRTVCGCTCRSGAVQGPEASPPELYPSGCILPGPSPVQAHPGLSHHSRAPPLLLLVTLVTSLKALVPVSHTGGEGWHVSLWGERGSVHCIMYPHKPPNWSVASEWPHCGPLWVVSFPARGPNGAFLEKKPH